ncbi:hypothetical protein CROQUDRAFT_96250 [Cronartium quercuum f. sp. fusiforme G11]|uniref:Pectate lyase n=1 Tax=Cronartium quercuum f. sp. fusiforme G11 TaxID=708437 RepID=A0A9P6NBC7_9BASI|nr:hypothetical protein CROQUDRAFT_96250 [Cronartium quercuum f. sp. fusiforme G11]
MSRLQHPSHIISNRDVSHAPKVSPYAPNGLDCSVYIKDPATECVIPEISETITVSSPTRVVAGQTFDCKLAKYQHVDTSCNLEVEQGASSAVFILEEGATLMNCFLGFSQESVHCPGECKIQNSHWLQVCDDAMMFHQPKGVSTISGCSFSNAGNKAVQFNGAGNINIENTCFYNVDIGYRSCGTGCTGASSEARSVSFKDIQIRGVNTLAGFNHKAGDTVTIGSTTGSPAKVMCKDKAQQVAAGKLPVGCTISS